MGKSSFATLYEFNKDLAVQGAPMVAGLNADGSEIVFMVAKWANDKHEKEMLRRQKQLQRTRYNRKANTKVQCEIFADTILIGWKNVLDTDGKLMPDTRENKIATLEKYKEFRDSVVEFALDNTNFLSEGEDPGSEEDNLGN